jgi:hypothetical protein
MGVRPGPDSDVRFRRPGKEGGIGADRPPPSGRDPVTTGYRPGPVYMGRYTGPGRYPDPNRGPVPAVDGSPAWARASQNRRRPRPRDLRGGAGARAAAPPETPRRGAAAARAGRKAGWPGDGCGAPGPLRAAPQADAPPHARDCRRDRPAPPAGACAAQHRGAAPPAWVVRCRPAASRVGLARPPHGPGPRTGRAPARARPPHGPGPGVASDPGQAGPSWTPRAGRAGHAGSAGRGGCHGPFPHS